MAGLQQITVLTVGKIKEKYLRDAIDEYSKRLSRYCRLNVIEVADEKTPDDASDAEEEAVRQKEAQRLLKVLPEAAYVITLEIEGKQLTSPELADKLSKLAVEGSSHIVFVIGGSLGLGKDILKESDMRLSFSKMTFPHQLMRVILLEQIYRSYRIINNEPYHK
ncbi:MAG: 23S rRNA (pseudouridine(1915)-N(3))-methyltransferase RlmH [Lachnospiraceae bacterium]|nr:23S rRNA (pseudouridine(1915)-N(3))-methyltransferase RlmH [Lachnospiraceae bacterium]